MKPALKWLLPAVLLISPSAKASDAPAAPAAGKPAVEEPKPWLAIQTEVSGLKTKRQQLMSNFTKAAEEKAHMKPGSAAFREKNAELVKIHKELKTVTEDYNRQLIILKYRFPERLAKQAERKYEAFELPEKEELEAQFDLDSRLNRSLQKARSQFARPDAPAESGEGRQPSSVAPGTNPEEEPLTIREENAPLFRK